MIEERAGCPALIAAAVVARRETCAAAHDH